MTTETTALQDTGDSRRSGFVNDVKHAAGRADELMTDLTDGDGKTPGIFLLAPDAGAQPGMRVK